MRGECWQRTVVFKENNELDAKIDKITSMIGNISSKNRQAKPFKPRVHQGRGRPLTNSGRGVHYNDRNNNDRIYDNIGQWNQSYVRKN